VVNNILALGGRVSVLGVVGEDEKGALLRESLRARGAVTEGIVADASRPTTRKTRIVAHNQQVMRVDREQTHRVSREVSARLVAAMELLVKDCDAIVVSDYNKGVVTNSLAQAAVAAARARGIPLTANPKPPNAQLLQGASVISLNQSEAETLAGNVRFTDLPTLEAAGTRLLSELHVESLLITQGSKGLSVFTRGDETRFIEAHPVEVYDVAGAGDTVISALTLSLAAGAEIFASAEIANHAAACVVRHTGVATVTQSELLAEF
jgi:D-beta-D-heptose 7-phosphate kinase/D-beta-D-heptose 1-phosphate adenosyltransferase